MSYDQLPARLQQLYHLLHEPRPIKLHWIGILGSGMWPLAKLMQAYSQRHNLHITIQGSDLRTPTAAGYPDPPFHIFSDHSRAHLDTGARPDGLIYTAVASPQHIERQAATELAIPQWSRGELMALMSAITPHTIICTGTCGKTSTTGLIAFFLQNSPRRPTVVMGGGPIAMGQGGFIPGHAEHLLIEADESDGTHQLGWADIGLITATTADHLDHYGSYDQLALSFKTFAQRINHALVIPTSEAITPLLKKDLATPVVTVGTQPESDVRISMASPASLSLHARQLHHHPRWIRQALGPLTETASPILLTLPPLTIAMNAALAWVAAQLYSYHPTANQPPTRTSWPDLRHYQGVHRRLEVVYTSPKLTIINDYAHNPEKVVAAITIVQQTWPEAYLEVIFEPHKSTRILEHFTKFCRAFAPAHHVLIAPLYEPAGLAKTSRSPYDPQALAQGISQHSGTGVSLLQTYAQTGQRLTGKLPSTTQGRVILIMGAGRSEQALPYLLEHFKVPARA